MSVTRPDGSSIFDEPTKSSKEITNSQGMKVLAFIIVVMPPLLPLNIWLWTLVLGN
jgi:hypothetical protein